MMRAHVLVASVVCGASLGCNPGGAAVNRNLKLSPLPADATEAQIAECERRLRKARRADYSMRANPDELVDSAQYQRPDSDFPDEDNPCRAAVRDDAPPADDQERERRDRTFAKVRARTMLDSSRAREARDALRGAFGEDTPEDPEVSELAKAIGSAYRDERVALWKDAGALGRVEGQEPGCVFSSARITGMDSLDGIWFARQAVSETVHVACALPGDLAASGFDEESRAYIELRRRVGSTRYVGVDRVDVGALAAHVQDGFASGSFDVSLDGERAYYEARLTVEGAPVAQSVVAADGFFMTAP